MATLRSFNELGYALGRSSKGKVPPMPAMLISVQLSIDKATVYKNQSVNFSRGNTSTTIRPLTLKKYIKPVNENQIQVTGLHMIRKVTSDLGVIR